MTKRASPWLLSLGGPGLVILAACSSAGFALNGVQIGFDGGAEGDGAGDVPRRPRLNVDELVLADAVVHDGEPSGGDEAVGGRRRKAELVGAPLRGESSFDDRKGALRLGRPGRRVTHLGQAILTDGASAWSIPTAAACPTNLAACGPDARAF